MGITAIYSLLGALSYLAMPGVQKEVPVWFPVGFGLAVLLIRGFRYIPAVIIGSAAAAFTVAVVARGDSYSLRQMVYYITGRSVGSIAESITGAWLMTRYLKDTALYHSVQQTIQFAFWSSVAAVVGCLFSCLVFIGFLRGEFLFQKIFSLWASGFISIILIAPFFLSWKDHIPVHFNRKRSIELVTASAVLALVVILSFGKKGDPALQFSLQYLVIPIILWILYRFNHRYGMIAVVIVVINILTATGNGIGIFSLIDPVNRVLVMQVYVAVLITVLMLVGSYIGERMAFSFELFELHDKIDNIIIERTRKLERTEERFRSIFNTSPLGIELFDKNGDLVDANETALGIFGLDDAAVLLSYNILQDTNINEDLIVSLKEGHDVTIEFWYDFDRETRPQAFPSKRKGRKYLQVMVNAIRTGEGGHFAFVAMIQDLTERKNIEDSTLRSEERLSDIQHLARLGSWEFSVRKKEFSISNDGRNMVGLEENSDFTAYRETIIEDDRELFEKKLKKAEQEGTPFEMEVRHKKEGLSPVYTLTRVHPLSRNGRIREIIGSMFDITELKEIEGALRKSENTFKTIFSQSPLGIIMFDTDGLLIDANPATLGIFGILEIDIIKDENLFDNIVFSVEDRGALDMKKSLRFTTEVDFEIIRKKGIFDSMRHGTAYIEVEVSAISSLGYLAQVRDMSRAYMAERAIRENEERLQTIFDNAGMGIAVIDRNLQYIDCNNQWLVMLGYGRQDLIGQDFSCFTHPDDLHSTIKNLEELVDNTINNFSMEKQFIRKDGSIMWSGLSVTPIHDPSGSIESIIAVIADITELKNAQQKLIDMATHDPLTGLPNRRLFYEKLGEVLARSKRQNRYIAVLFLDLDGFKEVNDQFGHDGGDALLQDVAGKLRSMVREVDIVSRLGGDEFTIILESVSDDADIIQVTSRIIEIVASPFDINGSSARVTASIGISIFPRDGDDIDRLIKKADDAMYESKKKGKNRFTFYSSGEKDSG